MSDEIKPTDKEMLDWLDKNAKGYGSGWICRGSFTGRGLRLHETSFDDAKPTVREAIADAMKRLITEHSLICGDNVDE